MILLRFLYTKITLAIDRYAKPDQIYHLLFFGGDVGPQSCLDPVVSNRSGDGNSAALEIILTRIPYLIVCMDVVFCCPDYLPTATDTAVEAVTAKLAAQAYFLKMNLCEMKLCGFRWAYHH